MNFIASCNVNVQYRCLSVIDASLNDLETPGFFYLEEHHRCQGFAWMPGTVNFPMLNLDFGISEALVEVYLSDCITLSPDTIRAVQVPFSVGESGISIFNDGDIVSGTAIKLPTWHNIVIPVPQGQYALVCEIKCRDDEEYLSGTEHREVDLIDMYCCLTFMPQENSKPAILRADDFLSIEPFGGFFLMEAGE